MCRFVTTPLVSFVLENHTLRVVEHSETERCLASKTDVETAVRPLVQKAHSAVPVSLGLTESSAFYRHKKMTNGNFARSVQLEIPSVNVFFFTFV